MTEQEVEAYAARLMRVWKLDVGFAKTTKKDAQFVALIDDSVNIEIRCHPGDDYFAFYLRVDETPFLFCYQRTGYINDDWAESEEQRKRFKPLVGQWLPFFRRNCWLSGCPLDVTAHEKLEWIHGFTRQELEAWNLNF